MLASFENNSKSLMLHLNEQFLDACNYLDYLTLMKIRQIIAESKIKETCELIENIIEQG